MNERVIELANKANEDIGYTFKLEGAKQLHELMEKFAELIVRECADFVSETATIETLLGDRLKEHFGVE